MFIFFEEFESYLCDFIIEDKTGVTQKQTLKAPKIVLIQQFVDMAKRISMATEPYRVSLKRPVKIWNQFDNVFVDREYSVSFANNAFADKEEQK